MDKGALTVVTPPGSEPITLADLKTHLRVDAGDISQDTPLGAYLSAVRAHIELIAGIAFLDQKLEWAMDTFPWADGPSHRVAGGGYFYWPGSIARTLGDNVFGAIVIPRPPLTAVNSVKYIDPSGALITMDPSLYIVDTRSYPARVTPAYGTWWPTTRWQPNAVIVNYQAGYANGGAVPANLLQTLRVAAGMLYEYREEMIDGPTPNITRILQRLLAPIRVWIAA